MNCKIEKLQKSRISLAISLSAEEMKKYGDKAVANFVAHTEIKGFRVGKAPSHLVAEYVGQSRINDEAINIAIEDSYQKAIAENEVSIISHPKIDLIKFVPNQELEFKAEVDILPEVKLSDYKQTAILMGKAEKKEAEVSDEEVEKTLDWLAKSRSEKEPPAIDDNFAKSLGNFENLDALKKNIKEGLLIEKKRTEKEKFRMDLVSKIAENSKMDIPDSLIESEIDKMAQEFKYDVERGGMEFNHYLEHIKKTQEELRNDFRNKAVERVKIALVMREIGKKENIKVSDEELVNKITEVLSGFPGRKEDIDHERLSGYAYDLLTNEKIFETLENLAYAKV